MTLNANNTQASKNKVWAAGGIALTAQSSNPIVVGDVGLYRDTNGVIQLVYTDGTTRQLSSAAVWNAVRVATAAVLPNTPTYSTTTKAYTAGSNVSINTAGIDGVTNLAVGDRVLVKDQATASRDGIYEVTTLGGAVPWVLTRTTDAFSSEQFAPGKIVAVNEGSTNADHVFLLTTDAPITLDTTSLTFTDAPLSITYADAATLADVVLTENAGVSATVARGDHVHALSQSIAPTWTDLHTFGAGVAASGASANDFSGSTGTFKTSSGANTLSGDTTMGTNKSLTLPDGSLLQIKGAGTGTGDIVARYGGTTTEGLEIRVYEATVSPSAISTNLINTPTNSVIYSVQANCESALTGGGTTATWSIGVAGTVNKYGTAGNGGGDTLAKNGKLDFTATPTRLSSAEQMILSAAATGGAAAGDTALTVGSVRVRVVYATCNSLDDAP